MSAAEALRRLPAVDRVLQHPEVRAAVERGDLPRPAVVEAAREVLERIRSRVREGGGDVPGLDEVARQTLARAGRRVAPRLGRVINATGVVLHTNLGRAPLAEEAREALLRAAGYCNVEFRLATGERGHRHEVVEEVLRELTGAEAACVVNNNAAAVLLGLSALARDREVVVSRGELVEIGGSFRVPDVMAQSGAVLREVGTTNKTHLDDYERAIGPDTALLLKVHTSNYRILGFTASVPAADLVRLARAHGLAVMEDLGSGCFVDLAGVGVEPEPTVAEAVAAGVDLVTFSGDKLLGGPQAGILVGRRAAVDACARHPLMRALRPDKLTLAALEATLGLYRDPTRVLERVPALRMLSASLGELEARARGLARELAERVGSRAEVGMARDVSRVGGGALPLAELPTWVVEIRPAGGGVSELEARLRRRRPPVVGRVREGVLVLDPRTVETEEEADLVEAVARALDSTEEQR
ncbi:L-seryl-tRNA(Sec) selenium transferase [Deferrisoma camini]|uniref:L-seryl-tRNA(Sec) selenium transferase n=1 Tax=Deferrisoma camini TaxID=1035120 RepID=UPI00046D1DB9|nr:L-seryl-tRNA(Sec) selenium transferase [Deferrisoma camini]